MRLENDTVIIITADYGEEFRERTRIGHEFTVYNELIHVPLVIKIPNKKPITKPRIFIIELLFYFYKFPVFNGID